LSFFWEIQTFKFFNKWIKNRLKRVSVFDWNDYCDWEEWSKYAFQKTVKLWAHQIYPIDKDKVLKFSIYGGQIDVSKKVKKQLGIEFQQYHLFQKFSHVNEIYIHGLHTFYLQKYTDYPLERKQNLVIILIESANIVLEHLGTQIYYSIKHLKRIVDCVKSLLIRKTPQKKFQIVWNAVAGPDEISLGENKFNCLWILENTDLNKEDVVFIFPRAGIQKIITELNIRKINYVFDPVELIKFLSFKQRLKIAQFSIGLIPAIFKGFFKLSIGNEINYNKIRLLCWNYLVPALGIKTYVNSVSHALNGEYYLSLLNQLSVDTILYLYSANSSPPSVKEKIYAFHMSYSNFLHKYITVWHYGYAKDIHNTYDKNINIKVTGPLIPAREMFKKKELDIYRKKYIGKFNPKSFYVCVFDVTPTKTPLFSSITTVYSEEYCLNFIKDINRLMNAFSDIVILYKPKRSATSDNHPQSEGFVEMIEKNRDNPSWITLDHQTNSWLPILLSDLVIAMPFSSTCLAALNKNKFSLFHNPGHLIKYHFYDELNAYISNSFEELVEKVKLIKNHRMDFKELRKTSFYVPEPKGGFNQGFVNFLRNPKKECTPRSVYIQS